MLITFQIIDKKQDNGEIFTSQLAECTVESLINKKVQRETTYAVV